MPKIQQQISNEFLKKLKESQEISDTMIEQLRELFSGGEKLKVDVLANIFSAKEVGDLK